MEWGDKLIYFTSDLHFGHKNIIKYENRPFKDTDEMDLTLIKNWNEVVANNDEVYILGDFSFRNQEETKSIINKLNGQKYLILGNHDHVCKKPTVRNSFAWVKDYYVLKHDNVKFVLFHFPMVSWDSQSYGSIHLHGHIHSRYDLNRFMKSNFKNTYNVGADVNNYKPISIDDILRRLDCESIL